MRRLIAIQMVNNDVRKPASHAGGVSPIPGLLRPCKGCLGCADAGNANYARVVRCLMDKLQQLRAVPPDMDYLEPLNDVHLADCVEAALAAGNMARDLQRGTLPTWAGLEGGAATEDDVVVQWLARAAEMQARTASTEAMYA